jgi:tripartite-type tricarboxylate transporter receptor subunit TctC
MITANSAQAINPGLQRSSGFDPVKDFQAVAPVVTASYELVTHNNLPVRKVSELIAAAKPATGKYMIASTGNGTLNRLLGKMLGKAEGIDLTHVPYKPAVAAVNDLVGGQVQLSVPSPPSSIAFIRANRLRVIGVVNEKRVAALPDAPTISETLPGFGSIPWYGIFALAGAPRAVVAQLNAAIGRALEVPETRERLAAVSCEPYFSTPEQFATLKREDLPRWARIVKDSGATID